MKTTKMINFTKKTLAFTCIAVMLASCSGGGGNGQSNFSNPNVTATNFVNALNDVDGSNFPDNYMVKDEWDTVRSAWDSDEWFVYYDDMHGEYVAASLQYIRSIVYYDYYRSNFNLAEEYRDIQDDDEFFGGMIGDGYGDDYEVVDYDHTDWSGEDYFVGFDSGHLYDDGEETTDVSLMAADKEDKAFYAKAAKISMAYEIDLKTSLSLVTLGQKVEKMLKVSNNELTLADQAALMSDIEKATGVSLTELNSAMGDDQKKAELIEKVADHIGTSAENMENRLLPDLFSVEL